jgi:hypothetical protein
MARKPILVANAHKQVFTLPELSAEHARWLDLAETALHNPEPREPQVNPESRAREQNQKVRRRVRDLPKPAAWTSSIPAPCTIQVRTSQKVTINVAGFP